MYNFSKKVSFVAFHDNTGIHDSLCWAEDYNTKYWKLLKEVFKVDFTTFKEESSSVVIYNSQVGFTQQFCELWVTAGRCASVKTELIIILYITGEKKF